MVFWLMDNVGSNSDAIASAFTNATGNMTSEFISNLPMLLGVAVAGFVIGLVYKAIKKVRKGGK